MATSTLVLDDLLCFAVCYIKKQQWNIVKQVVPDFYNTKTIIEAKERLCLDVASLGLSDMPNPSNSVAVNKHRLVEDILNLFQFVLDNNSTSRLPTYVSDNPDQLPQVRADQGCREIIFNKLDKLESDIEHMRNENYAVRYTVAEISAAMTHQSGMREPVRGLFLRPRVDGAWGQPATAGDTGGDFMNGHSSTTTASESSTQLQLGLQEFPSIRSSIAPTENPQSTNENPYTTVYNNRHHDSARNKRPRPSDSPPVAPGADLQVRPRDEPRSRSAVNNRVHTAPAVIGRSTRNDLIKAAAPKEKKSVFCISNVDGQIDADSLANFLRKELNINVLTIFPTQRSKNPEKTKSSSAAFRVCIPTADEGKLLDSDRLPDGIAVRE